MGCFECGVFGCGFMFHGGDNKLTFLLFVCIDCIVIVVGSMFILRNVVDGIPMERGFPTYSPLIKEAEVVGQREVNRNKLYYLREKPLRESTIPGPLKGPSVEPPSTQKRKRR